MEPLWDSVFERKGIQADARAQLCVGPEKSLDPLSAVRSRTHTYVPEYEYACMSSKGGSAGETADRGGGGDRSSEGLRNRCLFVRLVMF